jgi:hypothetical protein
MSLNKLVFSHEGLSLMQCRDGFWLYDDARSMNLAIRAESERHAMLEALKYYRTRLQCVETKYRELTTRVELFVESCDLDAG